MSRYIDADNLMKALEKDIPITANPIEVMASVITMLETVIAILKEQSTADVRENVRGEWGRTKNGFIYCSNCEATWYDNALTDKWHYCPNCGADMRGGDAE